MNIVYNILDILGSSDNYWTCKVFAINVTLILNEARLAYRYDDQLNR